MAIWGTVAKMGAGMLKGRAKKQTGAAVASKVTGIYSVKANPNATSSELDAKKIVPVAQSTQNISQSTGGSKSFNTDKEAALHIKKTTIQVATLLKGSLVLDKMRAKNKKKTQEQLKRTKAEDQLEKDNKGKFNLPIPGAKKVKSFWEKIKNFFLTVFLGFITLKLAPLLPHLLKALPLIIGTANFLIDFAVGFVDVLASAIKIGYDAYDWTRSKVEENLGEDAAEKFDSFMGGMNQVMNAFISLGLAAAAIGGLPGLPGGKSKGTGKDLDVDPKTKKKVKPDEIVDSKTKKVRKKTPLEIENQKKNKLTNKQLDEIKLKKSKINPKTGKKWTNVDAIADVKKPGFWGKMGQRVGGAASAVGKGVVSGATAVGKGVVTGATAVGKVIKGAFSLLPDFNKLGKQLGGAITDSYNSLSKGVQKQYDNVVQLGVRLKGKWDNALKGAGEAFNNMKAGAKQKIMDTILTPVMKVLEPLKKKIAPIGKSIMGVLRNIPGYEMITKVLKKFGGAGSKEMLQKLGAKSIPIIGGIINLAFAYDRLANGDTIGGLIEGASGILDLIGMAPASMAIDAYMFARDFVPQIQQGEDKAIATLGLTSMQNDMDKMFSKLPDLGSITKMITGNDKEKKEAEDAIKSGTAGSLVGGGKEEPLGQKADVKDDVKEGADTSISKGAVKDQEKKLLATNQESGAQGVIDSISTRASYEEEGADMQAAYDSGFRDGSSSEGVESPSTKGKGSSTLVLSGGGGDDPYEGLYKGG